MSKRNFLLASTAVIFAVTWIMSATITLAAASTTFNINVTCENGTHQQKSIQQSSSTVANVNISCGNGKQGPPGPQGVPGVPGKNGINGTNGKDAPPATICIQTANFTCPVVTINSINTNNTNDSLAQAPHSEMSIIPMIPR